MEGQEERETDVGLKKDGRWDWGHRQGRGARGVRRLSKGGLTVRMEEDEERLRRRYLGRRRTGKLGGTA